MEKFIFLASLCLFAVAVNLVEGLPKSVDWRAKGVIPAVKNQGMDGDSKGITVLEAMEASRAMKGRGNVTLSLTEYENCCKNTSDPYECIKHIGGLARDEDYPRDSKTCMSEKYKPIIRIATEIYVPRDEKSLAEAVVLQPVVVTVDASHMLNYTAGVYSDPKCSSTYLDHEMLLVGYDTTEDGVEYWLCQNSWGKYAAPLEVGMLLSLSVLYYRHFLGNGRSCQDKEERSEYVWHSFSCFIPNNTLTFLFHDDVFIFYHDPTSFTAIFQGTKLLRGKFSVATLTVAKWRIAS